MWTSNGKMICNFGGQVLCTRAPTDGATDASINQHGQSQAASGNPTNYVVSVSQSKKYLFSFMMKDTKPEPTKISDSAYDLNEKKQVTRINQLSREERRRAQNDSKDPAYFFAPNAFINVIDIMREQVIAQIRISPPPSLGAQLHPLSTYFNNCSSSFSVKNSSCPGKDTLSICPNRPSPILQS